MNVKEIINSTCLYGPGNTLCALLWRNVLMNPPQTYYVRLFVCASLSLISDSSYIECAWLIADLYL